MEIMTQVELQAILKRAIGDVMNASLVGDDRDRAIKNAEMISLLAKQSNNIAKTTLLADKMCGRHDRIDKMIGEL